MRSTPTRSLPAIATHLSARLLLVVSLAAGSVVLDPDSSASAGQAPRSTSGLLAIATGTADAARFTGYGYVVLNAWEFRKIPRIKRASPGVRVLVYKDISSTRSYACQGVDDPLLPTGVGFCWAKRHAPRWFLRDGSGRKIEWEGYPEHWWMDVGRRGYQRRWARNVIAQARRKGFDGVMADNAIVDPRYYLPDGRSIQRYPTERAYRDATRRFLARVGPRVRRAGLRFIPNIGGADASPKLLRRWSRYTSGFLREFWARYGWSGAPFGGWAWERQIAQMRAVQRRGKAFLAVTYGGRSDVRLMRYARASFLLIWSGGASSLFYRTSGQTDPWNRNWTRAIGSPRAPRFRVGPLWRRNFGHGTVVVNPSGRRAHISLGRVYLTEGGARIRSITLRPASGVVLRTPA